MTVLPCPTVSHCVPDRVIDCVPPAYRDEVPWAGTQSQSGPVKDPMPGHTPRASGRASEPLGCRCMARPGTPTDLQHIRSGWARVIAKTGSVKCRRCGKPIHPGDKWELGHPADRPYASGNRDQDLAPEHARCNKSGLLITQQPTFNGWTNHPS